MAIIALSILPKALSVIENEHSKRFSAKILGNGFAGVGYASTCKSCRYGEHRATIYRKNSELHVIYAHGVHGSFPLIREIL
jgi:hypothetical protein